MLSGKYIFARLHYMCPTSGLQLVSVHPLYVSSKVYCNIVLCAEQRRGRDCVGVSLSFKMFHLCLIFYH